MPLKLEEIVPTAFYGKWKRFKEGLPFEGRKMMKTTPCVLVPGRRGSGKSSVIEAVGTHADKIIDLFGARDNESLSWCRSPYDKILHITGDSTDVKCSWNTKHIKDLQLHDLEAYEVIISCPEFYASRMEEHTSLTRLMQILEQRTHWNKPWFLAIREASNLIYSRISIGEDQTQAKHYFIYLLRQARHYGYAVGADTLRMMSIDIDLRTIADQIIIKAVGVFGLPKDLRFIYRYWDPFTVMRMPPWRYIALTNRGGLALGNFQYPWWHKEEKEDLMRELDISVDSSEQPVIYTGSRDKRIGDRDHEKIIALRYNDKLSLGKIAKAMGNRSKSTIHHVISIHNEAIKKMKKCARCERVRGNLATTII